MSTLLSIVNSQIYDLNVEKLYLEAESVYLNNNDVFGAAKLLEQILTMQPKHDKSLILKGDIHLEYGNKSEAINAYKKALEVNPFSSKANSAIAAVLDMIGNTHEAYSYCLKAFEYIDYDNYEQVISLYDQKISLLIELGNYKEVRKTLKQATTCLEKEDAEYLTSCYKNASSSTKQLATI